MKEYTEEEVKEILDKIEAKDENVVKEVIQDLHPADIAELLQLPQVDMELAIYVFNLLDDETAAETLMELDEDKRHALLENIPNKDIAKTFIENLDTDDAVDLIQELDKEDQEEVLSHVGDVEQAGDIIDLMKYDDDTAGG